MDDQRRNRRILFGGAVVALVAYSAYTTLWRHHHGLGSVNVTTDHDDKSASANAGSSDNTSSSAEVNLDNGNGAVGIKLPGFSANVNMPGLNLNNGNFDIDGLKLYPGAKIGKMNVKASTAESDDGKGTVNLDFEAPVAPNLVHDYYAKGLTDHGYTLDKETTPMKIVADKDGEDSNKHVELLLTSSGATATHGVLTLSGD